MQTGAGRGAFRRFEEPLMIIIKYENIPMIRGATGQKGLAL